MCLCGRRFSDNVTGRFLTRDPLGLAGGLNLYAYVGNNPVNLADPSWLCPNLSEHTSAADDLAGRHQLVNSLIDSTEQILVASALGPIGGGDAEIAETLEATAGADSAIQQAPELQPEMDAIRALPNIGKNRNLAYADVTADGNTERLFNLSGGNTAGVPVPTDRLFTLTPTPPNNREFEAEGILF